METADALRSRRRWNRVACCEARDGTSSAAGSCLECQRLEPLLPVPVPLPVLLPLEPPRLLPPLEVPLRLLPLALPAPLPDAPAGGQLILDCASEPLPPLAELPAPEPEPDVAAPRFAELEPCDGLCDRPELPSGQSAEEPSELEPLVPEPLRLEPLPLLVPLEEEPDPVAPDPMPLPEPLGELLPDGELPDEELPLVCDHPGWSENDIAPANASAVMNVFLFFMQSPFDCVVEFRHCTRHAVCGAMRMPRSSSMHCVMFMQHR